MRRAGLGVALARHGAPGTASATGGLALFLVAEEGVQKQAEEQDQPGDDEDGGKMVEHGIPPFEGFQIWVCRCVYVSVILSEGRSPKSKDLLM